MKTRLIAAALGLLIAGCGAKKQIFDPLQGGANMKEVTDTRACTGPGDVTATIYGKWHQQFADVNGFTVDQTFDIGGANTIATTTCGYPDGYSLPVSASVGSGVNGNQFSLTATVRNTADHLIGSQDFHCDLNLAPITWTFQFKGPCLVLTTNNITHYMVR
jgi:hypothetical protein